MFDVGWPELMLIAIITVLVVGPKELPRVLRTFTMWIRRLREIASEFHSGLDDLARDAELEEIQKELADSSPEYLVEDVEKIITSDLDMEEEFETIKDGLETDLDIKQVESETKSPTKEPKI